MDLVHYGDQVLSLFVIKSKELSRLPNSLQLANPIQWWKWWLIRKKDGGLREYHRPFELLFLVLELHQELSRCKSARQHVRVIDPRSKIQNSNTEHLKWHTYNFETNIIKVTFRIGFAGFEIFGTPVCIEWIELGIADGLNTYSTASKNTLSFIIFNQTLFV